MSLEILYKDEYLIAINKPHGLLVHRSAIAKDATEFAVQSLRDQLNQKVYPTHRLDRKTSGVLLFALNEEINREMHDQFSKRLIHKKYKAIVRGYTEDEETIDYPLKKENGTLQEAVTKYRTIKRTELNIPLGRHETIRYSLVEVTPITGRMHQIRKHFAHILHPIIGDRPYGCNKQNRFFKGRWNMDTMMLHADSLSFFHPVKNCQVSISAGIQAEFQAVLTKLDLD
ncbi:MAG TPA: pseudouridine synthase [Cytophagales bacterium]|nr:pseudouridine synthase [Cytophagales bacterium]